MKKLLNISVVVTLTMLPLVASATVADADPGATTANGPTATYAPKYGLAQAGENDDYVVTAGYVKGAYNAAIKAINRVSEVSGNAANQDLGNLSATGKANVSAQGTYDSSTNYNANTVGAAIKTLQADVADAATQNGVVATVKNATASATGVSLTVSGTPEGSVSSTLSNATMSGTVNMPTSGTVDTLTVWGNDNSTSTASVTLATTPTGISGGVTGTVTSTFTGSGIDAGTATGDITGIDVDVTNYSSGV